MNRSKLGRLGVLFLTLIILLGAIPSVLSVSASWIDVVSDVPEGANIITTQNGFSMVQLWHYSGGYWGIHTSHPLRINDSQIKGDLEKLAEMIDETVNFSYTLPDKVKEAVQAGQKVGVSISHNPAYDYFNTDRGTSRVQIDSNELSVEAYPKFHLLSMRAHGSYEDFVRELSKHIPFVNPQYGTNAYSMFTIDGTSLGVGTGYYNPDNSLQLGPEGTIHPSQIADNTGKLKSGFKVKVGGIDYDSNEVKIGHGTFQNAGAVGLTFYYNLTITYYEIDDTDVAVTAITPTVFQPSKVVGAQVTVKNLGNKEVTTPVAFSIPDITAQSQDVTLLPGETKTLLFTFTSPPSGSFPMTATINLGREFTESDYTNNTHTETGQVLSGNDVAVTKIEKTSYPATSVVTADVTVKNLGTEPITTPVAFSIPGVTTQNKDITLAVGQTQTLHFTFSTPASGTLSMTAEANKTRVFSERDYSNNKLTVSAAIVPAPTPSSSDDIITWTEDDEHWEPAPGGGYPCYHRLTYETKLAVSHSITPQTLKSGYGFAVTANATINTRMVKNDGCTHWGNSRANIKIPVPPDKAQVKLGWTVKNRLGTQPASIDLKLLSKTATQSKFEPVPNAISEIKAKQIYTGVALAGTATNPKNHKIVLSITGGGVNGKSFRKEIIDQITINGVMYDDDFTGAN